MLIIKFKLLMQAYEIRLGQQLNLKHITLKFIKNLLKVISRLQFFSIIYSF